MKTILAALAIFSATPAMAFELYHCTVNDVTDGFFNTVDLKVDGQTISGSTVSEGAPTDIGGDSDTFAFFYKSDDNRPMVALVYQPNRDVMESLAFSLQDVTGKLGNATRYSEREGFGEIERKVQMTCDMATPI